MLLIGSSATNSVRINRNKPPKLGAWLTPKKPPPNICYHVKFGGSASKGICLNRREPPTIRER